MDIKLLIAAGLAVAIAPFMREARSQAPLPVQVMPEFMKGIGTQAVPGKAPGSRRYNVVFKKRSFDMAIFYMAVNSGQTAETVEAIVKGLMARADEETKTFRDMVENKWNGRVAITFWLINAVTIEVDPKFVPQIAGLANVLEVQPDLECFPLIAGAVPYIKIKTATDSAHHNADAEHLRGNTGKGFGVAIVDTSQADNTNGVNKPHRTYYIKGNKNNKSGKGIDGSRLVTNQRFGAQAANNSHRHGTGVASIAAGANWGTSGADNGHAFDADIAGYSICNRSGSCGTTLSIEASAWQAVARDKVKYNIVAGNMSYGSSPNPTNVSQMAIDSAALAGVLPVTAAGNSGSRTTGSSSTANGLAVGASNNSKVMASFSSRGPLSGDSQRFFPDIAANGVSTVMALNTNESSNYVGSGTSMASPQVCGAAVLVKSANPKLNTLEIKGILLVTTESISAQNPGRNRNSFGMGYLRDDKACNLARKPNTIISRRMASTSNPNRDRIIVKQNQKYSVVLVWNRLVMNSRNWSDLNLRILNGNTVVGSSTSPRNLYEKVTFTAPLTGLLTVEVSAKSLEQSTVPYVVVSEAKTSTIACQTNADYTLFGKGCQGSGIGHSGGVILPAANKTTMGSTSQNWPHGLANSRYQQVFRGSEVGPAAKFVALALRQDESVVGAKGGSQALKIQLGATSVNENTLGLDFAKNFDRGTPTTVVDGTVNFPVLSGKNNNPAIFDVIIPFTRPYTHTAKTGENLLIDIINSSSNGLVADYDAVSGGSATTSSNLAISAKATKAITILANAGLVMCFQTPGGGGATPMMTSNGIPFLGGKFDVKISRAVPSSVAILFLGTSDKTWGAIKLPLDLTSFGAKGCSLLTGGDFLIPVPLDKNGDASVQLVVPMDTKLCGAAFFNQFLIVDQKANNLGLVFTNGGKAVLGR